MTPREHAALAVEKATAALDDARKWLREEVKAEIAAMPKMPDVRGRWDAVRAMNDVMGTQGVAIRAGWVWGIAGTSGDVTLRVDGYRMAVVAYHGDRNAEFNSRVIGECYATLDAAVKAALLWLADRDVFVEVKR